MKKNPVRVISYNIDTIINKLQKFEIWAHAIVYCQPIPINGG